MTTYRFGVYAAWVLALLGAIGGYSRGVWAIGLGADLSLAAVGILFAALNEIIDILDDISTGTRPSRTDAWLAIVSPPDML